MGSQSMRRANGVIVIAAGCLILAGCSASGGSVDAESAHANARDQWKLSVEWGGQEIAHPIEMMDIYLVDPEFENEYAETFDVHGEGVRLVGAFPMDLRAGYGEELENLVGRTVKIEARGGDPREPGSSFVRLGGANVPVTGGTMTFKKVTGKWAGMDGDRTLWGEVELEVEGADGAHTLKGAFAVHAVTWG